MAEDWRQCIKWLIRCQVLSEEHRVNSDSARVTDLVNLLKDGVLICNLLNHLNPETLDSREFSQRPQMSQFLCQKNINVFLKKCSSVFKIKDEDLFEIADLTNPIKFGKVLNTFSILSQTPQAQKSKIAPLLLNRTSTFNRSDSDADFDSFDEEEEDDRYLRACAYDDDETIYGCLVDLHKQEDVPAKTKRDFAIEEIIETEKNYLEALEMIKNKFMKPLKECKDLISPNDYEKIFMGNEKLLSIHRDFLDSLKKACSKDGNNDSLAIPDCFVMFKEKFLFYGEFCSNLTGSQELLSKLCQSNPAFQQKIIEYQKNANEGKFKLHDLLAIPMQRVLKYHLLISELMKNTEGNHSEKKSLERALEEMQDLSLFVNEVRRDHEILNAIFLLEKSILNLPVNIVLRECGRILMDGEIKVKLNSESTAHTRHLFLFDKRLLICKAKNDMYIYKTSLLLSSYKLDDTKEKTSFLLQEISGNAYLITAKNTEVRNRWRNAILHAQENVCPHHAQNKKHDFQMASFDRPTICDVCRKFLRGFFFQGYRCQQTKMVAHKECLEKARDMDGPPTPLPPKGREKVITISAYSGLPRPPGSRIPLKFGKDENVDIVGGCGNDAGWFEGELNGQRGYFPRSHVKVLPSRKPSSDPSVLQREHYINLTAPDVDIDSKPWYAGEMTRDQASEILENLPKGTFVVRRSCDGKKDHAISMQHDGVKHMKIGRKTENDEEEYFLVAAKSFPSITSLVEFHSLNSLEKMFPDVKTTLLLPYKTALDKNSPGAAAKNSKVLGFCVAKYDYGAMEPNHLTLKRGDRIEILSKAGDNRGWWRGSLNGKNGYFPKSYVKEAI